MVVLGIQKDVGADDTHTHLDDGENDYSSSPLSTPTQHRREEAVDVVVLVRPDGREDEENFNEDRSERQKTAHQTDEARLRVKGSRRNRTRQRRHTARVVGVSAKRATDDGANGLQRQRHQQQRHQQHHDVAQRERVDGSVRQRDDAESRVGDERDSYVTTRPQLYQAP